MAQKRRPSFSDGLRFALARGWISKGDPVVLRALMQAIRNFDAGFDPPEKVSVVWTTGIRDWREEFERCAQDEIYKGLPQTKDIHPGRAGRPVVGTDEWQYAGTVKE